MASMESLKAPTPGKTTPSAFSTSFQSDVTTGVSPDFFQGLGHAVQVADAIIHDRYHLKPFHHRDTKTRRKENKF